MAHALLVHLVDRNSSSNVACPQFWHIIDDVCVSFVGFILHAIVDRVLTLVLSNPGLHLANFPVCFAHRHSGAPFVTDPVNGRVEGQRRIVNYRFWTPGGENTTHLGCNLGVTLGPAGVKGRQSWSILFSVLLLLPCCPDPRGPPG